MLSANEITAKKFEKHMGGYKPADVDAFLADTAAAVAQLNREIADYKRKLDAQSKRLQEFEGNQASLSQALLNAQRMADNTVKDAQAKAELTLRDAQIKADRIKEKVREAVLNEQEEFNRVKTEVVAFRTKLLDLYREQVQLIMSIPGKEILPEDSQNQPEPSPVEEKPDETAPKADAVPEKKPVVPEEPAAEEKQPSPQVPEDKMTTDQQAQPTPVKPEQAMPAAEAAAANSPAATGAAEKPAPPSAAASGKPEDRPGRDPKIRLSLRFDEKKGVYLPENEEPENVPEIDTKFGTEDHADDAGDADFSYGRFHRRK